MKSNSTQIYREPDGYGHWLQRLVRLFREWRYRRVCLKINRMTAGINWLWAHAYGPNGEIVSWYLDRKRLEAVVAREVPLLLKSKLEWQLGITKEAARDFA